ncbi:hypothetical protein Hte_008485 [Hypoxylon texense]
MPTKTRISKICAANCAATDGLMDRWKTSHRVCGDPDPGDPSPDGWDSDAWHLDGSVPWSPYVFIHELKKEHARLIMLVRNMMEDATADSPSFPSIRGAYHIV